MQIYVDKMQVIDYYTYMGEAPSKVLDFLLNFMDPERAKKGVLVSQTEAPRGRFPAWVTEIAKVHQAEFGDERPFILIEPRDSISVDQGARLHKVVSEAMNRPTILIADKIPAKGRGTLVRLRIPHVVGDHAVFAPELGLHYRDLHQAPGTP